MKNLSKKLSLSIITCSMGMILFGCNATTKYFGGTSETTLQPNKKVVECTWKDSDMWILTRDMREDEEAETYQFSEESNYGIFEGKYIIHEQRSDK